MTVYGDLTYAVEVSMALIVVGLGLSAIFTTRISHPVRNELASHWCWLTGAVGHSSYLIHRPERLGNGAHGPCRRRCTTACCGLGQELHVLKESPQAL